MPEETNLVPSLPKKNRKFKISDMMITIVLITLVAILGITLVHQLTIRHEVNSARNTSNELIAAIHSKNGATARQLGDKSFQAQHSASQLTALFNETSAYTIGTPEVVKQTVNNGKINRVVSVYYKFTKPRTFYVRVTVLEPNKSSTWHVVNFSGNASLTTLSK